MSNQERTGDEGGGRGGGEGGEGERGRSQSIMPSSSPNRPSPRWWERATAMAKDNCSIYLARARLGGGSGAEGVVRNPELETAIIKATSHDGSRVDYKNVGRVLTWVKISHSSSIGPLMWFLSRRVERTHDWVVALKGLMLAHSVLLCCERMAARKVNCLPFDLSTFRDRSSWGFTTFVRAYFSFLDHRSTFPCSSEGGDGEGLRYLSRLWWMQDLLDLLMQIRPYGDGMDLPLVLEAMDCVIIEIFDVYGRICRGIAQALMEIFGAPSCACSRSTRRRGVRILRRATDQSSRLSAYFDVCLNLGVMNASHLPVLETIPEEDIRDLEEWVMESGDEKDGEGATVAHGEKTTCVLDEEAVDDDGEDRRGVKTVGTAEWVLFTEETAAESDERRAGGYRSRSGNPFLRPRWESQRPCGGEEPHATVGRESRDLLS